MIGILPNGKALILSPQSIPHDPNNCTEISRRILGFTPHSMFALLEREVAGKNTMWYQGEEYRSLKPRRCPIPVPITCLDEHVRQFAELFRQEFAKPQYQARAQIQDDGEIEPAFSRPHIRRIADPLQVGALR